MSRERDEAETYDSPWRWCYYARDCAIFYERLLHFTSVDNLVEIFDISYDLTL